MTKYRATKEMLANARLKDNFFTEVTHLAIINR